MSNLRYQNTGEDYPDAAGKHLEDAYRLIDGGRFDGAGYLTGYAAECCLKSLIQESGNSPPFRHDLNDLSMEAVRLATLPNALSARYAAKSPLTLVSYSKRFQPGSWSETLRYQPEGVVSQSQCSHWILDTQELYDTTIGEMKRDGVI